MEGVAEVCGGVAEISALSLLENWCLDPKGCCVGFFFFTPPPLLWVYELLPQRFYILCVCRGGWVQSL